MNKKIIGLFSTALASLLLMSSCASSELPDPISVDEDYVNQQILIRAPSFVNTFSTNDVVMLDLKYNTTNEIVFPANYGVRIFEKTADGWVEIGEIPTVIIPPDDIILSPLEEMPAVQVVMVNPDLPNFGRKYSLRIYVIGLMTINGQSIEVMAFTDVVLKP